MHTALIAHINKYTKVDEKSSQAISTYFKPLVVEPKEYLLREGQVCNNYYFVAKGCLQMFYRNDKGVEQIIQFAIENWWLTDYASFGNQKPSEYNIQAIEQSDVLAINALHFQQLTQEAPLLNPYFNVIAQRGMAAAQFRLKLIFTLSKEDMYLHFSTMFPAFVQRIPLYMIASYLGITPEYLSEIRKKNARL